MLAVKALQGDIHTFHTFLLYHSLGLGADLKKQIQGQPSLSKFQILPRLTTRSQWIFRNYFR